jgi:hypothetical protein
MSVLLVNVDEGNNEGVCDDVLDMEKIATITLSNGKVTQNQRTYGNQRNTSHRPITSLKYSRSF